MVRNRSLVVMVRLLAIAAGAAASTAQARQVDAAALQSGRETLLTLDNGDVIKGVVLSVSGDSAVVQHPVFGQVNVPLARIVEAKGLPTAAELQAAAEAAKKAAEPPPPPAPAPEAPAIPEEAKLSFWQGWDGRVEGGINGSDGNTETFSGRVGFGLKRVTDAMESVLDSNYQYATDNGRKSKSRGEISFRNDWLFKDSPWGFFAQGKAEYDEFQDWDWRLSAFAGPSYTVIKNDTTTLRLRAGAGISYEIGGADNEIVPEALFGVDFAHKLTKNSQIFLNHEFLPSLKNFSDFRTVTKGGYEVLLDPESKMSLKLGAEHRHDSEPGPDQKKNDLDYFALIAWNF